MTTEHVSVPRELIEALVKQWKQECMAFADMPAGIPVPKRLYLWNRVADLEDILSRATPSDDRGESWEVRFICCGRDDGNTIVNSYTEADAIRESYTSGVGVNPHGYSEAHEHDGGHQRAAIVSRFSTSPKDTSAPRVVTDADVERACSAYYGRGIYAKWENFDEFAKASQREYMRAALESFVNGGSNE